MEGALGLDLKLGGWPIELQHGAIASAGGTLTAKSLPAPLRIGALNASVSRGEIDFAPAEISFVSTTPSEVQADAAPSGNVARNSFVMRGSLFSRGNGVFRWPPDWNFSIEGATSTRAGLARSVRSTRAAHQFRLDHRGRTRGEDTRGSSRGVARSAVAWDHGFSWADFQSRVHQSAVAHRQSSRRICAFATDRHFVFGGGVRRGLAWFDRPEIFGQAMDIRSGRGPP